MDPFGAVSVAEKVISVGWTLGGYPKVSLSEIPWIMERPEYRSWNFDIHSWDMLDHLLKAYSESGLDKYLKPAVSVALEWCNRFSLDACSDDSMAWYDMAVGVRAYRLAYIIDATDQTQFLEIGQRELLWLRLMEHQQYLSNDKNIMFHNNHGYFQAAGQIAMGRRFKTKCETMRQAYEQGYVRLKQMLDQQFAADGVHKEHSPDYHRMVFDTLRALIDAGLIEDQSTIKFSETIELALSWFILPNQHIANFGDSDYRCMHRKPEEALRKWQTPQMQFLISSGGVGQPPENGLAIFKEGGFYIVRKENSYIAQIAAFHSRTHKHADDLSFIWSDKGSDILVDAGRYGYIGKTEQGSELWLDGHWYADPNRIYCESTRAHNTLEFDEKNYPRRGVKPYGSAIQRWVEHDSGLYALETECKHFGSIRHARVLLFMPGRWLVVFDWFHDNLCESHDVRQWFHLAPNLCLEKEERCYSTILPNGESLKVVSLLAEATPSDLYIGAETPRLQGWWSPKERELIPNYAFCYEQKGIPAGVFASLFSFSGTVQPNFSRSRVNSSGRKGQFEWLDDFGTHTIRLERPKEGAMEVFYERK